MKKITQAVSIPMMCALCDKYMGDVCIAFNDPSVGAKIGKELHDFLNSSGSFPLCAVCSAQGYKMGYLMGRK